MAFITLNTQKLKDNFHILNDIFEEKNITWAIVAKLLCGNQLYLEKLLELNPKQICDSRASNLQMVKKINPNIETIYIKPPPKRSIDKIVRYANISFNTELETIKLLSIAAKKQNLIHKVVIMVELGELREGILGESLISFYESVFELPHIEIIGIGTNLTCMYGVLPNADKLVQLSLYKQILEVKFNKEIPFLSGGASVTIPLIFNASLPKAINHFRVGETLYLGTNVYNNSLIDNMHYDVFKLYAEIIELHEKPMIPSGELGYNLTGHKPEFDVALEGTINYRAIIDLGLLDIEIEHISPLDSTMNIVGASSDMIVIDLEQNKDHLKVGDLIAFKMDYMGILRIMNSDYVDKKIE